MLGGPAPVEAAGGGAYVDMSRTAAALTVQAAQAGNQWPINPSLSPQEAPLAHVHGCGAAVGGKQLGGVVACWGNKVYIGMRPTSPYTQTCTQAVHACKRPASWPSAPPRCPNSPGKSSCCITACLRSATCSRTPQRSCTAAAWGAQTARERASAQRHKARSMERLEPQAPSCMPQSLTAGHRSMQHVATKPA